MAVAKIITGSAALILFAQVAEEVHPSIARDQLLACVFSGLSGGALVQCRLTAEGLRSKWLVFFDMGCSAWAGVGTFAFADELSVHVFGKQILDTPEKLWFVSAISGALASEIFRRWTKRFLKKDGADSPKDT